MTFEIASVAIVALVCGVALAALVLVLRHLRAMRATDGEMQSWGAAVAVDMGELKARAKAVETKHADFEQRLTHIDNRTKR